jgi:hypothetical protein
MPDSVFVDANVLVYAHDSDGARSSFRGSVAARKAGASQIWCEDLSFRPGSYRASTRSTVTLA